MRVLRGIALAGVGVVATTVGTSSVAQATPARGVSSRAISQATVGGKDFIAREITLAPGGSTGWHYHPGTIYGLVRQGVLTHNASDCSVDGIYRAGQTVIEPSGSGHVHIGRNLGRTPVILDVLYVDPAGSPLAVSAPNPGCGFQ